MKAPVLSLRRPRSYHLRVQLWSRSMRDGEGAQTAPCRCMMNEGVKMYSARRAALSPSGSRPVLLTAVMAL